MLFSRFNAYITLTCIIVRFIDVFSFMNDMNERKRERERERENGEIERKAKKLKEKTE